MRLVSRIASQADGILWPTEARNGLAERVLAARGDNDLGTLSDEPLGDPQPNAAARAGDDRHRTGVAAHGGRAQDRGR